MSNIAVIYYSISGNVHRLAEAAAAAAQKAGAEVRLLRILGAESDYCIPGTEGQAAAHQRSTHHIPDVQPEDLEWADGLLIGTPVRFGLPAAAVLRFVDSTAGLSIPGRLRNKAVSVFCSGSAPHGGVETAILSLHNALCHWGSVIVPNGSTDPVLFQPNNGNPYGTASVSRNRPGNVHEENIASVEYQAARLTEIATALRAGLEAA